MNQFTHKKRLKKSILSNYTERQKGFSLIEMMVVVVILGIIVLGLVTFFTGGAKSWVAGQSQLKAQREARQAMDQMVREIRKGRNVESSSDNDTITISIPALGSESNYNVTFNLLSGSKTIQRTVSSGTNNLINDVIYFNLIYYNNNGILVDPPDTTVSKVHIELKVDVDDDGKPDITLNTDVNLRNYGL